MADPVLFLPAASKSVPKLMHALRDGFKVPVPEPQC